MNDWIRMLGVALVLMLCVWVFRMVVLRKLKRWSESTHNTIDDFVVNTFSGSIIPILYLSCLYYALDYVVIPDRLKRLLFVVFLAVVTFYILNGINKAVHYLIVKHLSRKENGNAKAKEARGLVLIVSVVIWVVGIVFFLNNLGYDVTTIVAGLGIGGAAIALAAQAILGDLFSYFVIYFDKPFEIGDFIALDDKNGTIESVGIKTTRIRTLSGEQLICSNKDLTDSRVHNFKRMAERYVSFTLTTTFQTSTEMIRDISSIVEGIVKAQENVRYDRGHLAKIDTSGFTFEFVYYVLSPEYMTYMNIQQSIYLATINEFLSRGIEFAYTTQTVFLKNSSIDKLVSEM